MTTTIIRWWFRFTGRKDLLKLFEGVLGSGKPGATVFPKELIDQALELLLSGVGNTLAIHSNRQWLWPYWVEQQQNPRKEDFIPTGVNVVTTNLSHRNWTTLGCYDSQKEVMIDPVGMITMGPFSWSVMPYLRYDDEWFLPPRMKGQLSQELTTSDPCGLRTTYSIDGDFSWSIDLKPMIENDQEWLELTVSLKSDDPLDKDVLVGLAIRPYNMLTMSPIHHISYENNTWSVNRQLAMVMDTEPDAIRISDRQLGDPIFNDVGMGGQGRSSRSGLLSGIMEKNVVLTSGHQIVWHGRLCVGDVHPIHSRFCTKHEALSIRWPIELYSSAFQGLSRRLHVFDDIDHYTPGSFFYHRHWIRDSAFLMMADLNLGRYAHIEKKIEKWLSSQKKDGVFNSQKGEWDSTGQVLFLVSKVARRCGNSELLSRHQKALERGARWIIKTRLGRLGGQGVRHGLLPSGLSAEHFGPNDHYFWDNYWSLAGLKSWFSEVKHQMSTVEVQRWEEDIHLYMGDVMRAMEEAMSRTGNQGLPCAPTRSMDSAAIGNLVAVHPLGLFEEDSGWVKKTVDYLYEQQLLDGLFYQDIIHTGLNCYLTLQLASVMMLQRDERYVQLLDAVLRAGGSTWSWPEAIHPRTGGGCMGDGDHGWVLSELINLLRDSVVLERNHRLEIGIGWLAIWFDHGQIFETKALPIDGGTIDLRLSRDDSHWTFEWKIESSTPYEGITLHMPMDEFSHGQCYESHERSGTYRWS